MSVGRKSLAKRLFPPRLLESLYKVANSILRGRRYSESRSLQTPGAGGLHSCNIGVTGRLSSGTVVIDWLAEISEPKRIARV